VIQRGKQTSKNEDERNLADPMIHLLQTASKAIASITAILLVSSPSPSPEGIAEGLENRCLKKSISFPWKFAMRLG
jgi:hypothetical protein